MPSEVNLLRAFFMLTYTATNTKTGQFYIGSALNYCRYMARVGAHHTMIPGRGYTQFQKDLQEDPLAFKWEWSEDDKDDRSTERSLIALFTGSEFLYNVGEGNYENRRTGWKHTEEAKKAQSEKNKQNYQNNPDRRERVRQSVTKTNSRRVECPHCGLITNPGNLTKHLKGTRCKGK
jgi:hypothetical protein